ncbi:MAG: MmgE/PrpD family protein [Betaproteobacteria bacterium]
MITERLAGFVVNTTAVPDAVLTAAQDALIDTVGVALAGTLEPASVTAARWVSEIGAAPIATLWGRDRATSIAEAAFGNGIASHALDFDDTHPGTRGHTSAILVSTVLAVGEATGAAGEEVLAAYALAHQVGAKIGRALGPGHLERGWHPTATVGTLAATAAASRLWGLDMAATRHAWGIAASGASGLMRNFGTMTKPFHAGQAARCGVAAAWMARAGFTADESIFDGKGGFLATYRGETGEPIEKLLDRLGKTWELLEPGNYVKRWPCCYSNHRAVGGLQELVEQHGVRTDEVDEVTVGFLPGADTALVSCDPHTGLEGKFSIEYTVAALLHDRALTLKTYTDAMVQRPAVRELMKKVRRYRIPDEKTYSGVAGYNDIALSTRRGRFEMRVDRVPGSLAWPMTEDDRIAKFMDCAALALGTQGAQRLLALCRDLRTLPDVRALVRATVPVQSARAATRHGAGERVGST